MNNQSDRDKLANVRKVCETFFEAAEKTGRPVGAIAVAFTSRLYDVLDQPILADAFLDDFAKEIAANAKT